MLTVGTVQAATVYAVEVSKAGKVLGYFREGYPQTGAVSATGSADHAELFREEAEAQQEAEGLGRFFPAEERGYSFRAVGIEVPPLEVKVAEVPVRIEGPAVVGIEVLEKAFAVLGLERAV